MWAPFSSPVFLRSRLGMTVLGSSERTGLRARFRSSQRPKLSERRLSPLRQRDACTPYGSPGPIFTWPRRRQCYAAFRRWWPVSDAARRFTTSRIRLASFKARRARAYASLSESSWVKINARLPSTVSAERSISHAAAHALLAVCCAPACRALDAGETPHRSIVRTFSNLIRTKRCKRAASQGGRHLPVARC